MIRKALLQVNPQTREFIDPNVFSAYYAYERLGVETERFTWPDLRDGKVPLAEDVLVVGGVLTVRTALDQLRVSQPPCLDYPACLRTHLRRQVRKGLLGEVRASLVEDVLNPPLFIKPVEGHKDFDGHVVRCYRDLIRTAGFSSDMPVWISDDVEFSSESRYFVRNGKILGVGHYRGDPLTIPDSLMVAGAMRTYEESGEAPAAYTLDFGALSTGETALVEVNDGFAFGTYGLNPLEHVKMLEARWEEMVVQIPF